MEVTALKFYLRNNFLESFLKMQIPEPQKAYCGQFRTGIQLAHVIYYTSLSDYIGPKNHKLSRSPHKCLQAEKEIIGSQGNCANAYLYI